MSLRWPAWLSHPVKCLRALPSQCLVCHAWPGHGVLCADCWQRFGTASPFRCTGCALVLPGVSPERPRCGACLRHPPLWQEAHAWVDYHYPWNSLITRWKFGQQPALAHSFAEWMLQDARIQNAIHTADVLIPIPLSQERMRERGYNQAAQLTQAFQSHKHQLHTLTRAQHAAAQSGSTRAQRLRNLRGAFAVEPEQRPHIQGKTVLLIDDVMTTGATLTAASRCLLQTGARQIHVLCMARTP